MKDEVDEVKAFLDRVGELNAIAGRLGRRLFSSERLCG
jgi:hypothetical protein